LHNILIVSSNFIIGFSLKTPFEEIMDKCGDIDSLKEMDLELLPRKWELLGNVLILKLDPGLKEHWFELAEVYADVLQAKAVLRRFDIIRGVYREPGVELLVGDSGNTETIHKENKVVFKLDPLRIMFSSGNIDERIRISTMASRDEVVVDMFSGIGYFALPIAVHSRPNQILACELNPKAYDYLCQNIKLNKVENIVRPIQGDNRTSLPNSVADRIIMGYLKCDRSHLESAFEILKPKGGTVHFHDVGFKDEVLESAFNKVTVALTESRFNGKFKAELANHYYIKSFGPKLVHIVLDIKFQEIS
jgi:tRNA wybutosine-synthesizing protein 2